MLLSFCIYSPSGGGQQCCYDVGGNILPFDQGGGTYDRAHYKGAHTAGLSVKFPIISHFIEDVLPFIYCCKESTIYCVKYSDARPTDDCTDYISPRPGEFIYNLLC